MKPGTFVRLPDGREGTVVYHGLDGYGIVWGRKTVDVEAILSSTPIFSGENETNIPEPKAMLREPYPSAIKQNLECVGEDYEVVE